MSSITDNSSPLPGTGDLNHEICMLREALKREKESHLQTIDELQKHRSYLEKLPKITEAINIEKHYRAILENSPDGVVLVNSSGKMTYASPSARKMFGFESTEALAFDPAAYTHPDELEMVLGEIFKTMANPGYLATLQYRFRSKTGEWKWIESVISNQLDDPAVGAIVINFRDIHDKMLILKELQEAKESAEKANRLKDSFISAMSHEIRTPITGITGMVSVIADSLSDEDSAELTPFFESIYRSSNRLVSTVEDILNFSLLQSGNYVCNNSAVRINQIISDVLADMDHLATAKSLRFERKLAPEELSVFGDSRSIYLVISKLAANAIKFTKEGFVKVEVEVDHDKESVLIRISDTGVGISPEYLPTLFDPFSQEEGGFGRSFEGLGLGLPIVKKLVDLMQASIEVESQKNSGTVFTLYFKKI